MQDNKIKQTYQFFIDKGLELEEISKVLEKCPELSNMDEETLERKITCMFNSDVFYGIIICNHNEYRQVLSENVLSESNEQPNFIVENLINTVNKPYLQKIMGITEEDDLEMSLYKMRQSNFNSTGYKVK